jgi:hypothetical protein
MMSGRNMVYSLTAQLAENPQDGARAGIELLRQNLNLTAAGENPELGSRGHNRRAAMANAAAHTLTTLERLEQAALDGRFQVGGFPKVINQLPRAV